MSDNESIYMSNDELDENSISISSDEEQEDESVMLEGGGKEEEEDQEENEENEEDEEEDENEEIEIQIPEVHFKTKQETYKSIYTDSNLPHLKKITRFVRTRALSLRAQQLEQGAVPFISIPKHITDPYEIAKIEFENKVIPYVITYNLPDGSEKSMRLKEMI